jgi:MarR family transcriptional regulator, temperature-dependent positive regulator of motility
LLTVRDDPGADQSRISALTSIDVATLTPVLVRLEQRGLITRKVDPNNKRRKMLFLTDDGRGLVDRISQLALLVDDTALHGLSRPQIDTLIQTLRSIAARPLRTATDDGTGP